VAGQGHDAVAAGQVPALKPRRPLGRPAPWLPASGPRCRHRYETKPPRPAGEAGIEHPLAGDVKYGWRPPGPARRARGPSGAVPSRPQPVNHPRATPQIASSRPSPSTQSGCSGGPIAAPAGLRVAAHPPQRERPSTTATTRLPVLGGAARSTTADRHRESRPRPGVAWTRIRNVLSGWRSGRVQAQPPFDGIVGGEGKPAGTGVASMRIPRELDRDSTGNWTPIPGQTDRDSTGNGHLR